MSQGRGSVRCSATVSGCQSLHEQRVLRLDERIRGSEQPIQLGGFKQVATRNRCWVQPIPVSLDAAGPLPRLIHRPGQDTQQGQRCPGDSVPMIVGTRYPVLRLVLELRCVAIKVIVFAVCLPTSLKIDGKTPWCQRH